MKCKACKGSWIISEIVGGPAQFCPLCGNLLEESKKTVDSIPACFSLILSEQGKDRLKDSKYVLSLVADLLPKLTSVEKRILKVALDSGVYKEFLFDTFEAPELLLKKQKAINHLVDEYGLSDMWAESALQWLLESIYGDVFDSKQTTSPGKKDGKTPSTKVPASEMTQNRDFSKTSPKTTTVRSQYLSHSAERKKQTDASTKRTTPYSDTNTYARNISQSKEGETVLFGSYLQHSDRLVSPIEWIVLKKESDKALLLSKNALACREYHSESQAVTWESCSLRTWLNNDFFKEAFNGTEQNQIIKTIITANENPKYKNVYPGGATNDKVFLLSINETQQYLINAEQRKCTATNYAKSHGSTKGDRFWWLRSPGFDLHHAADVLTSGSVYYSGDSINGNYGIVRPAIWVVVNP